MDKRIKAVHAKAKSASGVVQLMEMVARGSEGGSRIKPKRETGVWSPWRSVVACSLERPATQSDSFDANPGIRSLLDHEDFQATTRACTTCCCRLPIRSFPPALWEEEVVMWRKN